MTDSLSKANVARRSLSNLFLEVTSHVHKGGDTPSLSDCNGVSKVSLAAE